MTNSHDKDKFYLERCFDLAQKGEGHTSPNPLVGALFVLDGKILGEGYHKRYGGPHAEVEAFRAANEKVEGSTLYTSLEPCCHTNKQTPPCTGIIISAKVKRVVVAALDPNPSVAGKGMELLKAQGIQVDYLPHPRAEEQNRVFFKVMRTGLPFMHLKMAQSLDGRIAMQSGHSKWISDEVARLWVHQRRFEYDAVMVGRQTLNADNPSLDIRHEIVTQGKIPWRVVVGNPDLMNKQSKVLTDEHIEKTLVISSQREKVYPGISTLLLENHSKEAWQKVLAEFPKRKICSVLVEGGPILASSLLDMGLIDRMSLFIAPKLLGNGASSYRNETKTLVDQALQLKDWTSQKIGNQILIEGRP